MSDTRKPWMIPIQYNDDRWSSPAQAARTTTGDDVDERDERDVNEILSRPEGRHEDRVYECNDTTPINYSRGPHDNEFGVDDETGPADYRRGQHDNTIGAADDDDFEPLDDEDPDDDISNYDKD